LNLRAVLVSQILNLLKLVEHVTLPMTYQLALLKAYLAGGVGEGRAVLIIAKRAQVLVEAVLHVVA